MLRNIVKGVMFLIDLRRIVLSMYLAEKLIDTHRSIGVYLCRDTLGLSHIREYICRILLQGVFDQKRAGSRKT
jgi:hypothetical protein